MDKIVKKKGVFLYKRGQKYFLNRNSVELIYPPFKKPFLHFRTDLFKSSDTYKSVKGYSAQSEKNLKQVKGNGSNLLNVCYIARH